MHVAEIRNALHQMPFKPFVLRLADGRSLSVPHPDFVAVSPRQLIVVNAHDYSVSWVEPVLVVSLEFAPNQSEDASGNGVQGNSGSPENPAPDKPA